MAQGRYVGPNGRRMEEKPEEMTQLAGNRLVEKDHPRIIFRGQMDLLQAMVVNAQVELSRAGADAKLLGDLQSLLDAMRQVIRSEVLDEPLPTQELMGLSPQELRRQSHDPKGFFGVEAMTLPHYTMGLAYAQLNLLRAQARVAEIAAVRAFKVRPTPTQQQLLQTMNRLSSAFHILTCRVLAGRYAQG